MGSTTRKRPWRKVSNVTGLRSRDLGFVVATCLDPVISAPTNRRPRLWLYFDCWILGRQWELTERLLMLGVMGAYMAFVALCE